MDLTLINSKGGISRTLRVILIIIIVIIISATATFFYNLKVNTTATTTNSSPCPSSPETPYISEYCVANESSSPNAITVDSEGNVWFIAQQSGDLGVFYSSNSSMRMFPVPISGGQKGVESWGIAVDSSRHLVWFSDYADNGIWKFNITTAHFTYYNVTYAAFSFPYQVVIDSKGNVWFTDAYANAISELTTNGKEINYPLPAELTSVPGSPGPFGLTKSPNGTLWFTVPDANSIGSLSLNTSAINGYSFHIYNMSGLAVSPVGIGVDTQGDVWFTQHGPSLISEFNPKTRLFRSITTFIPAASGNSLPYFLYLDSQGNIWFNEHYGNMIGKFITSNNSLVEYEIPTRVASAGDISGAITMNLGPNGTPWFTEWYAGKIGRVNLQAPINIGLSFQNSSVDFGAPLDISEGHNLTLSLNLRSPPSENVSLTAFLSTIYNNTKPSLVKAAVDSDKSIPAFVYDFSTPSGKGNFTSILSLQDQLVPPGTYYITISEVTTNIHVSKVIQVLVS